MNADKPSLTERARNAWASASYGARHPKRLVLLLAVAGAVAGLGETAIVLLLIALASGGFVRLGFLNDLLPEDTLSLTFLSLSAVAAVATAHWLSAATATRASAEVRESIQKRLVDAWFAAPWQRQVRKTPAELQHLIGVDVTAVAIGARTASKGMSAVLYLAVVLAAAIFIGPYTVLALGVAMSIVLALGRPLRKRRRPLVEKAAAAQRQLALDVSELGGATRELRVFGVVGRARSRLVACVETATREMRTFEYAGQLGQPLVRDATLAMVIIALGVVQATSEVTLAGLGATVILLLRALGQAQSLADTGVALQERAVQRERIEAALADWAPEHPAGVRPAPEVGAITLENVSFRHDGAQCNALTSVDLEMRQGELIGVIGRSGAGKTTLASLVLGLYTPTDGHVRVDGVDLREIDPADWHRRTAWVGQDPQMLTGTLEHNIRLFREEPEDDELWRAAHAAGLGPELALWDDGLAHPVGNDGSALSGGQRQRVAIARALVGDPRVMVLDEPTSALDVHAEANVRDLLATLRGQALVLVIAHRLSTLRACDRIAVFEAGRLTRIAPPSELRENEAYFREVLELSRAEPLP